jgi:TolB-like protein/Tfp pilus assembly protein PilF
VPQDSVNEVLTDNNIRAALKRVLKSSTFSRANQLARFLQFSVENTLAGNHNKLKEHHIGVEVYDRKESYAQSQDSIVRTEANRLRKKLKEYYSAEGKKDSVVITIEQGSYVASFSSNNGDESAIEQSSGIQSELRGVAIAVLPFEDLSGRAEGVECACGITEELIHALMNTEGCRVAGTRAVAPLLGQMLDIKLLAEKLAVQVVIEGTVRLEENRLRVSSRVVNADGFQLWSQRFDVSSEQPTAFKLQEQIASAMVSRISPQLSHVRQLKGTVDQSDLLTYTGILTGYSLLDSGTMASRAAALAKFKELSVRFPNSARAFCGIVQCLVEMTLRSELPAKAAIVEASKAIEKANSLDDAMLESYDTTALMHLLKWDWRAAIHSFQEGISLGAHAPTYRNFATLLCLLKRFAEAEQYLKLAQKIDPFSNRQKLASTRLYFLSREYKKLTEYSQNQEPYGGLSGDALLYDALARVQSKNFDEAKAIALSCQDNVTAEPFAASLVAQILFASGEAAEASRILEELKRLPQDQQLNFSNRCLVALSKGDERDALNFLQQAYQDLEPGLIWINVDSRYDSIRGTKEFERIAAAIFPEGEYK